MANLDKLLIEKEPEEKPKQENFGINELHISKYAYDKAFRYASLILQRVRRDAEIGGFLTQPNDSKDRVARDAFLARDQEVTGASYRVEAEDVSKAGKELKDKGQKIIGWWHSHGNGSTFHSKIDNNNQKVLLNQIAPFNYIVVPREKAYDNLQSRIEGNNLIFWDPENPFTKFQLELKQENPELVAEKLKILEEKRIGFSYSFVVNGHRWLRKRVPYCEIATRDLCKNCMNANDVSVSVGYKIFDDEHNLDDKELIAEIEEKVSLYGRALNKKYFLPETFEAQRVAGTLSKPVFPKGSFSSGKFKSFETRDRDAGFKGYSPGGKNGF